MPTLTRHFLALFVFLLAACSPRAPSEPPTALTILSAASLNEAFTDLGRQFEAANPGVTLTFNFAGSQALAQQLVQGAPADVFASANEQQMATAVQAGRVAEDAPQVFATNALVLITPSGNPAGLKALTDLARPGLKLVFADPSVPAGQYSLDFLDKAEQNPAFGVGFRAAVLQNVVSYEESVRAVLTKVSLGEADAGIVYRSDVSAARGVTPIEIPAALNVSARYPIAPTSDSANPALAQAFIDFVLSPTGQETLSRYGFLPYE